MRRRTAAWTVSGVLIAVSLCAPSAVARAQTFVPAPGASRPAAAARVRIAPLPESQWTDRQRQLVAQFGREGKADNWLATLLHVPEMVEAIEPFTRYALNESSLEPRHRLLLALRAAWLCGSDALWSRHASAAATFGLSGADVRRVAEGPTASGLDPFEATLLRMADELFRNSSITDKTWAAMANRFDVAHLVDAVETVNHFVILGMMANAIGVQPDARSSARVPMEVPYRIAVAPREPALAAARVEPVPGDAIAVTRTFARHPPLAEPRARRANFINRVSKLQPRHREMFILRIGWDSQSEYEWSQHVGNVGRAREHGLDPTQIALGPSAPGWDAFESTILRAVDELYRDVTVSEPTWRALAEKYDTTAMLSALFTASSYRATSMALNAFGVQLVAGEERFPTVPR